MDSASAIDQGSGLNYLELEKQFPVADQESAVASQNLPTNLSGKITAALGSYKNKSEKENTNMDRNNKTSKSIV